MSNFLRQKDKKEIYTTSTLVVVVIIIALVISLVVAALVVISLALITVRGSELSRVSGQLTKACSVLSGLTYVDAIIERTVLSNWGNGGLMIRGGVD